MRIGGTATLTEVLATYLSEGAEELPVTSAGKYMRVYWVQFVHRYVDWRQLVAAAHYGYMRRYGVQLVYWLERCALLTSLHVGPLVTLVAAVHYLAMREYWVQDKVWHWSTSLHVGSLGTLSPLCTTCPCASTWRGSHRVCWSVPHVAAEGGL